MNDLRRSVVITGMGAVSAAGVGAGKLWGAARNGESCIGEIDFGRDYPGRVRQGAPVKSFDPAQFIDKESLRYCDHFSQYALVAAQEAVKNAGLSKDTLSGDNCAIFLGTGIGGMYHLDERLYRLYTQNNRLDPLAIPIIIPSSCASAISLYYGISGPTQVISTACSSSNQAIGLGMHYIRHGFIDRAIVGGCEGSISVGSQLAWESLRVLTPGKCRPFSLHRNGIVIGDGAGIFILETKESALLRGAPILCEICGYGSSSDASDPLRPQLNGPVRAMEIALADAQTEIDDIDYINAHGTGTAINDSTEAQAIKKVFGQLSQNIPCSSTKPVHGHALGASGALELVCTVNALQENFVPPTINFTEPDPQCQIDCVPNSGRHHEINVCLSNSFAFGGINAVLAMRKVS